MKRYSRDLLGHGPRSPLSAWPGGAKIAVQVVLNYEEGGEYSLEHGDRQSEAFLSDIVGAANWPDRRHWNMETMYDYGARVGFWRLHRLLTAARVPVTVFGVTSAMARGPEQVRAMQDAGWEIASHGLRWIEYGDFTEAEERAHMDEAIRLHREITGARPRGWYTGRASMNTVDLATEDGGFDWVSDSYADELPYWHRHAGRNQLVIPYTLDANDARFIGAQGFSNGEDYFIYLRDVFDVLHADGAAGHPKIMSLGLHCRLAGKPGRMAGLQRFLAHAQSRGDVWFATRGEIATYWREHHPPATGPRPSQMDRGAFVAAFGDVYEHSPWVAEAAHRLPNFARDRRRMTSRRGFGAGLGRRASAPPPERKTLEVLPLPSGNSRGIGRRREDGLTDASTARTGAQDTELDAATDEEGARPSPVSNPPISGNSAYPFIIASARQHQGLDSPPPSALGRQRPRGRSFTKPASRSCASRSFGSWTGCHDPAFGRRGWPSRRGLSRPSATSIGHRPERPTRSSGRALRRLTTTAPARLCGRGAGGRQALFDAEAARPALTNLASVGAATPHGSRSCFVPIDLAALLVDRWLPTRLGNARHAPSRSSRPGQAVKLPRGTGMAVLTPLAAPASFRPFKSPPFRARDSNLDEYRYPSPFEIAFFPEAASAQPLFSWVWVHKTLPNPPNLWIAGNGSRTVISILHFVRRPVTVPFANARNFPGLCETGRETHMSTHSKIR